MGGAAAPPEGPRPTWPGRQGGAPPGLPAVARIDSVAVQRFPDGPATGGEAPLAPPPAPAASAEAGAAVDIDELVDRALRKLMRQIDIESERRGRAPWA